MNIRRRPMQVGQPPAEQQKATEGQGVGVDDPGQVVWLMCRSRPIVGSATFVIEASITIMNCVSASRASARFLWLCVSSEGMMTEAF